MVLAQEKAAIGSIKVVCIACGREHAPQIATSGCEACGSLLEVQHPLESLRGLITKEWVRQRKTERAFPYQSGVWSWRELVAPFSNETIVTRNEGNTNLYEDYRIAGYVGLQNLWMKHEGENPTGSFKDRGMTVGVSHAKWVGAKYVACASSGNTSAGLAGYAARAGIPTLVFIPQGKVSYAKLSQTMGYGAKTIQVEGSFDNALDLVRQLSAEKGIYLVNSLNPFRLEGQKTITFEMLEQLNWEAPDWIVLAGGNLGNTSAMGKALYELRELGLLGAKLPRIAVIQAEGASPFFNYYRNDFHDFKSMIPDTIATAINIGNPVNLPKAVRSIQLTDGIVESVTDAEIMEAKVHLDRSGIGGEPAAAAPLAGVKKLTAQGVIKRGDKVVCILTGHILKDADSIINYHNSSDNLPFANPPIKIKGTMAEVEALLED